MILFLVKKVRVRTNLERVTWGGKNVLRHSGRSGTSNL